MPPIQDVFSSTNVSESSAMSAQPPTPPSDVSSMSRRMQADQQTYTSYAEQSAIPDNTAAGMALSQEDSMYLTPAASPTMGLSEEKEAIAGTSNETRTEEGAIKHSCQTRTDDTATPDQISAAVMDISPDGTDAEAEMPHLVAQDNGTNSMVIDSTPTANVRPNSLSPRLDRAASPREADTPEGLAKVDLTLNRNSELLAWDFSDKRPSTNYPSSLFEPYSSYVGTQQSDRQVYNVEVTILTVDMDQCSMSGFLLIRGLTPEHPMLQTFFTGEIVGGPNQKHSFKTKDPTWGANDKVDLQHWLRFPPWRHLSSMAKRDMDFEYPLNDEPWHTQDHIFMRWKEHFLVPNYKESNIQGASFEGFYYICLNQAEGKISGVYFHSKSEKYQQLELTHVTKKGSGDFRTSPVVELR